MIDLSHMCEYGGGPLSVKDIILVGIFEWHEWVCVAFWTSLAFVQLAAFVMLHPSTADVQMYCLGPS